MWKKPASGSYDWDFGGAGAVVGGNGTDTIVYQYDAVGDYIVGLAMTESISGMTATDTITVTAEVVEITKPDADFAISVGAVDDPDTPADETKTVTLTSPLLPADIDRAYVYWGDRARDVITNPEIDLAGGLTYTYSRGGRSYNIRVMIVMTINSARYRFDYTYSDDGDLTVTIP